MHQRDNKAHDANRAVAEVEKTPAHVRIVQICILLAPGILLGDTGSLLDGVIFAETVLVEDGIDRHTSCATESLSVTDDAVMLHRIAAMKTGSLLSCRSAIFLKHGEITVEVEMKNLQNIRKIRAKCMNEVDFQMVYDYLNAVGSGA